MVVVDVLLALNLVLFAVCAVRGPRRAGRPVVEDVSVAARRSSPAGARYVPPATSGNIVPFRSREELELARAKNVHPSGLGRRAAATVRTTDE